MPTGIARRRSVPTARGALKGVRIGVLRFLAGHHAATDAVFGKALDRLGAAGATLVEIKDGPDLDAISAAEMTVLLSELKSGLDSYLATTPDTVKTRTMADVIAFNEAHHDRELGLFNQDLMVRAQATTGPDDGGYRDALTRSRRMAGVDGLDRIQVQNNLDAMVAPTGGPAWVVDLGQRRP